MVNYRIKLSKNHNEVKVEYALDVPVGGNELIASLSIYVDGENVMEQDASGNTKFTGAVFHHLSNEMTDHSVSFAISSSTGWMDSGSDKLRGERPFDDVTFQN
jgi:hypothetical protein